MNLEQKIATARTIGKEAFKDGAERIPALNERCMWLIEGLMPGEGAAEIMKSFIQGWDEANLAAPVKPDTSTCQICGRSIKSKTGKIAHHGYKRPHRHSGWQTASCAGARYQPYEQSRDRITEVLAMVKHSTILEVKARRELLNNPPATLDRYKYQGAHKPELRIPVDRPADFDPKTANDRFELQDSYVSLYFKRLRSLEREIMSLSWTFKALTQRFDEWKAPVK